MKRILLIFAFVLSYILTDAQFYGGFGCGDPDAWFNKEIYFYCQNVANNGYYGMNLNNVSFVIDGTTQVDLDGQWLYQDVVFLGQDNGFKFSKGSTVGIYVNGQYYGSWTCNSDNPSATDIAKRLWDNKPRGRSNAGKSLLKLLRKVKKIR